MKSIVISLLMLIFSNQSIAGGTVLDGNGGDFRPLFTETAWVLNRPISYCINISREFSVKPEKVQLAIKASFERWFNYIKAKEINTVFTRGEFSFPNKYNDHGLCSDHENKNEIDVFFEFGTSNELIEAGKKRYTYPAAFGMVNLVPGTIVPDASIDDEKKSKGLIWVANKKKYTLGNYPEIVVDWTLEGELEMILTHEIGQVFGIPWVKDTVMDRDLMQKYVVKRIHFQFMPKVYKEFVKIDQEKELYVCPFCQNQKYIGQFKHSDLLDELLGEDAIDFAVSENVELSLSPEYVVPGKSSLLKTIHLIFKSKGKTKKISLNTSHYNHTFESPEESVFRRYVGGVGLHERRKKSLVQKGAYRSKKSGLLYNVEIFRNTNNLLMIVFEKNQNDRPVTEVLFTSEEIRLEP